MARVKIHDEHEIRSQVRDHYGKLAEHAGKSECSCCGGPGESSRAEATKLIYGTPEVAALPESVKALSAGCGDPVTLAALERGQSVLDLGSGGGIDCFYAAEKVGPEGTVIGVDMTPAMLEKARQNRERLGLENVEFRLGEIEHLPVRDESIDVIISNCVINLSPDKDQVFREAFRVLKPGGLFAVSDIVQDGPLPEQVAASTQAWCECVSGALDAAEFTRGLEQAGFTDVKLEQNEFEKALKEQLLETVAIDTLAGGKDGAERAFVLVDNLPVEIELGDARPPYSARITAHKPGG
jgi:ubiquinone/menaquinone biosynthesis C-methylase UbiE